MDEERMKESWRKSGAEDNGSLLDSALSPEILRGERKTALTRLADRYRRFYTIAFAFAGISLVWTSNPVFDEAVRLPMSVFLVVYFLARGIMDWHLNNKVRDIDIYRMSTAEVIGRAMDCRKLHLQCMIVLMPFAIGFIGFMIWLFSKELPALIGVCLGVLFGGVFGAMKFREFMRDYKTLGRE